MTLLANAWNKFRVKISTTARRVLRGSFCVLFINFKASGQKKRKKITFYGPKSCTFQIFVVILRPYISL